MLLESIQSHSSGLYTPYKKSRTRNLPNFLRRLTPADNTADNADIAQLQATIQSRDIRPRRAHTGHVPVYR